MLKMDSQGQFSVSHFYGSTVDVAPYSTLQHPLHGYGGAIATVSGPQGTGPASSTATITLGYSVSHPPQCAATPPYSVALTTQMSAHPQIQYYYEGAEPLSPYPHVRYNTSSGLTFQPAIPVSLEAQPQKRYGKKKTSGTERTSTKLSRKHCRNRGEAYVSASGKFVPAKKYMEHDCQCRNKCLTKLGTMTDREAVFRRFWDIGDFGKQNAHLAQSVVMVPSGGSSSDKRRGDLSLDERLLRTVRRFYYVKLQEGQSRVRVCKSQFLRLHGVSNGRLDRVLQALHCEHPHALQDRRGQHAPSNKTAQEDLEFVAQHIVKLQQQKIGTSDEFVTQGVAEKEISVKKMHELYQQWCEEQGKTPVSLWVYRQVKSKLIPHQEEGNPKASGTKNSQAAKNLLMSQPYRKRYGTFGCQEIQEAVTGPGDTTAIMYKHAIGSTTLSQSVATSTSVNSTASSKPASTSTTNIATGTTSAITGVTPTTISSSITVTTTTTTTAVTLTTATTVEPLQQRKGRRKQRQGVLGSSTMNREQRKACRNRGEAYITSTGKLRGKKVYQDEPCECRNGCIPALGTPETRQKVFNSFWGLASFTRQNAYIARMVTLAPLSQRRTSAPLSRTYSRVYSVPFEGGNEKVQVCKLAFLRLHGVSNGRVDRVLQAVACQSPFALKDRRGRHSPINKTQEEDVSYALSHMSTFSFDDPDQSDRCCLPQNLNVGKMYRLYRDQCVLEGRKPVGSFVYRKILKERFNCHIKMSSNKTPEKDLSLPGREKTDLH
ncbi:uncharacterized protein LOC123517102 [Portunus trituberculatus]|uniref:uncharacterized protein LOC123517102 n=1 Tax=Portunus trituberculatus TaxID=210409 RepID=UPI001E1D0779|nr:uncharacterized protein LOC123517102 [Portunus trituberculatus]XP_045132927.1 uncharacterized protein LOC123517102 [Portunus trituberculatus]XP_045132928.1 uncharacterized protein LOC123517102 [Portunus trituberculatus]XP_045132929.1 uncharacterized protein LOC123517102 [Portunus trituberculatus]XP_045132930.1 uncharacterized protein LOC123517102 [Portunus trituberculatus]XP_045132931.1 uncharacterized protein LOC123517102 [Portunus trituberculatus]XP_045132932.1 uncharacterized protein LO